MKINIKEKHIVNGIPGNPYSCPLALAVREKLNLVIGQVVVTTEQLIVLNEGKILTQELVKFINAFDEGQQVNPIRVSI